METLQHEVALDAVGGWFGEAFPLLWLAKLLGALTGSIVSLAYVMPRGRRDAAAHLLVGVVTGLIFGGTAGVKLADTMGLLGKVSPFEITLMGATLASLCAWWGLGALQRLVERFSPAQLRPSKPPGQCKSSNRESNNKEPSNKEPSNKEPSNKEPSA